MKINYKFPRYIALATLVAFVFLMSTQFLEAQCPMCRIAAESNLEDGGTAGRGLNAGIMYMLATPYLVVGLIGLVWWRNRKKEG